MTVSPRKSAVLATAALAVLGIQVVTPATAQADPSIPPMMPASLTDSFYSHGDIAGLNPGDVIKVRNMPVPFGFFNVEAKQVQYRSTNSAGEPISAVTTVLLPGNRAPNGPLLSYQHIVNALGAQCAPSQTLWTSDPDLQIREAPALNMVLNKGWTVALPDHLGPSSAYAAGKLGGQITLDGIRAVQRVEELSLKDSPVGMVGYSGGGLTTAMAAAIAPQYAPELNIVGAAEGGVPMSIEKMATALGTNPHPAFGLAFAAAVGLEREYPDRMPITTQLNGDGLKMRSAINDQCTNGILALGAGKSVSMVANSVSMLEEPSTLEVMRENSVEFAPLPKAPIFEWHSPTDVLIPLDSIDATIGRYCAAGVPVTQVLTPSPEHMSAAVIGMPQAMGWLGDRFEGKPVTSNC